MRTFTYPAVIFTDPETGSAIIAIYDLGLFAEGDTVEEAHQRIQGALGAHMSFALKNGYNFNEPTPFKDMALQYPKEICVLVEAKLDNKFNPIN